MGVGVGSLDGSGVGSCDGIDEIVGNADGAGVGLGDGAPVGGTDGSGDGAVVGAVVGAGEVDGDGVGDGVGMAVGRGISHVDAPGEIVVVPSGQASQTRDASVGAYRPMGHAVQLCAPPRELVPGEHDEQGCCPRTLANSPSAQS